MLPNDNTNGGLRSDVLEWNLSGFDPNERVDIGAESETDGTNTAPDYRTVFFNNGGDVSNNSVLTVHYWKLESPGFRASRCQIRRRADKLHLQHSDSGTRNDGYVRSWRSGSRGFALPPLISHCSPAASRWDSAESTMPT